MDALAVKHRTRDSELKFGTNRFHTLNTTLKRLSQLIAKTTVLTASTPSTGQASAFVIQDLPKPFALTVEHRPQPTSDLGPTTTTFEPFT